MTRMVLKVLRLSVGTRPNAYSILRTALLCSFLFGLFGHGKNSSRSFYEMCASERHISFTFSDYSTFHTKYNPYSLSKTINRHIIHILLLN